MNKKFRRNDFIVKGTLVQKNDSAIQYGGAQSVIERMKTGKFTLLILNRKETNKQKYANK